MRRPVPGSHGDAPAVRIPSPSTACASSQARVGYGIGITLDLSLLALVLARRILPVSGRAFDAATLPELYVGLLVLGALPAVVGVVLSVEAIAGREIRWGSIALGLNLVFLLSVARLAVLLGRSGFFGFVMSALRSVVEV